MTAFCRTLIVLLSLFPLSVFAQAPEKSLDALRAQIAAIPAQPDEKADDAQLTQFIVSAYDVLGQTDQFVAKRSPEIANLDARLAELGPAPADGTPAEDRSVTSQRASLQKSRTTVDADIRRANLLSVDAQQAIARLIELRRQRFTAKIAQRAESPFSLAFWTNVDQAYPSDSQRLSSLASELRDSLTSAFDAGNRAASITGLVIGGLLLAFALWPAERLLLHITRDRMPAGKLRRSALAIGTVVAIVAITALSAQAMYKGLSWNGALSDRVDDLSRWVVRTFVFSAFVYALGRALLASGRESWRLPAIDDAMAARLKSIPLLLAAAIALTWLIQQINTAVGASLSATVMAQTFTALLLSGVLGLAVLRARQGSAVAIDLADSDGSATPPPTAARPAWLSVAMGVAGFATIVVWIAIAFGFIAFGSFLATQLVWGTIIGAVLYLLIHFIDDLIDTMVASRGAFGARLQKSLAVQPRSLDQAATLLSGMTRVCLVLGAVVVAVVPFGTRPADLMQMSGRVVSSWKIGEIAIAPGAIGSALLVLVGGLFALRILKAWLSDRFLPYTDMEVGMRNSITTLLGYVGGIIVVAMAMSALGIGLERIAWVASALSVGIGFGLQAIVQNFISGLILLAERPVRVGDWVVIGDTEGDVRRINVRATEIQLGDRSTLIVPNSEFITKTVRNVTLANAEGRVLIRLPMPLECEAERVRQLLLDAFSSHETVLDVPKPSVSLEGIQNGNLMFLGTAYVPNPRQAAGVRSDVLFDVLARLRAGGIELSSPQSMVLQTGTAAETQAIMPGMGSNAP